MAAFFMPAFPGRGYRRRIAWAAACRAVSPTRPSPNQRRRTSRAMRCARGSGSLENWHQAKTARRAGTRPAAADSASRRTTETRPNAGTAGAGRAGLGPMPPRARGPLVPPKAARAPAPGPEPCPQRETARNRVEAGTVGGVCRQAVGAIVERGRKGAASVRRQAAQSARGAGVCPRLRPDGPSADAHADGVGLFFCYRREARDPEAEPRAVI